MSEQDVFDALKYRAEVDEHGNRFYCNNAGKWHRENGPAIEWSNGTKVWYQNGLRHRTDGAAIEWTSGTKEWYQDGQLHRTDGPAIEYADGDKWWFINGERLNEAEFNQRVKKCLNKQCLTH